MSYIGQNLPSNSFIGYTTDTFAGDGSATTFTMSKAPFNESAVIVVINNVVQQPTEDFTISGTTLTIDAAVASGDVIYATHTGGALPIDQASSFSSNILTSQTDIGAAIVDADLFLVDDGAGGTLRKVAASRIKTYAGASSAFTEAVTVTTADNLPTLTLTSTDADGNVGPILKLNRDTASPADGDTYGSIDFFGDNDAGESTRFCDIFVVPSDVSNGSEDGRISVRLMAAGSMAEYIRITSAGAFFHGAAIAGEEEEPFDSHTNTDNIGILLKDGSGGSLQAAFDGPAAHFNRVVNDGNVVIIAQDGTTHGSISVSGSTTSYNAFTGSHWSRLADNSKPTILRGTVMESLDTMMNWYAVDYEYDTADGKTRKHKKPIALPDGKSVGDNHTITDNKGIERTVKIIKEDDVKHVYSKISTTADSTRVYGLFHCWDNDDDTVNDMEIAQVGTYIIRVHKDITVSAGDLLVSNGDGTAKKQDDDIIRSKTIAKVNSNVKVETYDDGSYTVPCTLHC